MEIIIQTTPKLTATRPGRLLTIGTIRAGLSPNAENSNCTISLDNGDGLFSRLLAIPPLGVKCTITSNGQTLFEGIVTDVVLAETASLTLEA